MPYPPPPPPPEVGEFQAIGLLPAPQLPDVTGHGGEFLETDGFIPQWEPVTGGALPDQTGHAGEFLTTDGVNASWATVSGGGVIAIGAVTTPTANAAIISGGNTLQLAAADKTNPGLITALAQSFSGLKKFYDQAAVTKFDSRLYGAVANDATSDYAQAFYNTLAYATESNPLQFFPLSTFDPISLIQNPPGALYTSFPLCMSQAVSMAGAGRNLTIISSGIGTASTPANAQGFSGPVIYAAEPYTSAQLPSTNFPAYTTHLVGSTGQALVLVDGTNPVDTNRTQYFLHDSWPWAVWIGNTVATANGFSLQFWVQVDDAPSANLLRGIIGSRSLGLWGTLGQDPDMAFGVYCTSDGADLFLRATLTTNPNYSSQVQMQRDGTQFTITSSAVTQSTPIHVELDYNGGHFDFYVDGVNQGHVVATGPIIKAPWEGVAIGGQGPELLDAVPRVAGINGAIDSIRLSKVARHTGTGSFTPPVAKYTWDSDTYALYNWDQGVKTVQPKNPDGSDNGPLLTLPFLVGQCVAGVGLNTFQTPLIHGPLPHYIRLIGSAITGDNLMQDFSVCGWLGASGIVTSNAPRGRLKNIGTVQTSQYGIRIGTGVSFFTELEDVEAQWGMGIGIQYYGDGRRLGAGGCGIGIDMLGGGLIDYFNNQPAFNSYAGIVFEPGGGVFTDVTCRNTAFDAEAYSFTRQIAVGVILGADGTMLFENNNWDAVSSSAPPVLYFALPLQGRATHINDQFVPNPDGGGNLPAPICSAVAWNLGVPPDSIWLQQCLIHDLNGIPLPKSNVEGFIQEWTVQGINNQKSISISDVIGNNLAGTFTVQNGYTSGGPKFLNPEPDGDYLVIATPLSSLGSGSPAAGSNRITFPIETRQDGFTATVEADPGGDRTVVFSYAIIRNTPPPLYFDYLPAAPSTVTNPLTAFPANTPFAIGVTIVPASGSSFTVNTGRALESIFEAGTTVGGTNWWEMAITAQGLQLEPYFGASATALTCFVRNGALTSLLSPGAHNVVLYFNGINGQLYMDGLSFGPLFGSPTLTGTQQTPIYIGERYNATATLTQATLRNLKIDRNPNKVLSNDGDIGPGAMEQSCFFGDDWTLGYASSTNIGGYASQIASARYTTAYYWMAAQVNGTISDGGAGVFGELTQLWKPWQGVPTAPALTNLCVMVGYNDLVLQTGRAATVIYDAILGLLEGASASATWNPPTSLTSPTNQYAFAEMVMPTAGTATCVINGVSFNAVFSTNSATTTANLITLINASAPTLALVTPTTYVDSLSRTGLYLTAVAVGSAGNGITCSTNGVGGSFWFGDVGGGIGGVATAVSTINGRDTTFTVAGVTFINNFDTDAATTVNNAVSQVNGDPTTGPLVTAANVANQMVVTADTPGYAGNSIALDSNAINTPNLTGWTNLFNARHLTGGSNGAIQNGIPNILLCNVPPFGTNAGYTAGKETQRGLLNALINAYVGAGVTVVDIDTLLADPGTPINLLPLYDNGTGYMNSIGHTALFVALAPLLPGVGTAPSALSYATNPAIYASGAPIASNNPTVTGVVVGYAVSPPLPAGLSLNSSNGHITGTPTTPTAIATYIVCASNTAGSTTVALVITIT